MDSTHTLYPGCLHTDILHNHGILVKTENLLGAGGSGLNYSYSGGSEQEAHGSQPRWENRSARLYLGKNPSQKMAGGVA
jgi:hypothetical protein